jgi:hypothetical protein
MESSAKIKIKIGAMEVEYEGDPSFLNQGLESLLLNNRRYFSESTAGNGNTA